MFIHFPENVEMDFYNETIKKSYQPGFYIGGSRDIVETSIDLSKSCKSLTWEELSVKYMRGFKRW
ncbi:hypothetical protein M0R19_05535 [Candidatus Pacearchaeota archaeon]|jgi:hypothetical protein|nr:hypothetical protein [Candidatus Pacearchaeota archaeon]